jgi:ribonuclease HI
LGHILRHVSTGKEKEFGGERENDQQPHGRKRSSRLSAYRPCHQLLTDSEYVRKGLAEWMAGWKRNGWQRREKGKLKPVANVELWQALDDLVARHQLKFTRVAGHSGHPENDRCDELAVEAYQQFCNAPPRVNAAGNDRPRRFRREDRAQSSILALADHTPALAPCASCRSAGRRDSRYQF